MCCCVYASVLTETYNHFHKHYSVQAAGFHASSQPASVRQCLEQPSNGISSSQDKMARRRTGSSVGGVDHRAWGEQWLSWFEKPTSGSASPRRSLRSPCLQCSALLGRRRRQRETPLARSRQQRKPLLSGSNLSQPGFLWLNGQSCLVVMPLQHSHSDPHDPVIVLGMSAKLSDTNYYN